MSKKQKDTLIRFPNGIPGFESYHHFTLIEEEDSLLANLISTENEEAGFILFKPQALFPDYLLQVELGTEEVDILDVTAEDTIDIWAILTLCQSDMNKTTINLRAPIIINSRTGKGVQLILCDDQYSSRQPLFAELQQNAQEGIKEGAVG